jgi:hypothetical protein
MRINWHADGEGCCHAECEQWQTKHGHGGCALLDLLPWEVFERPSPASRSGCPFAVLAEVLGLHERRDGTQLHQRGREDPQRVFGITPEMVLAAVKNHLAQQADDEARAALEKRLRDAEEQRLRERDAMDDPRR